MLRNLLMSTCVIAVGAVPAGGSQIIAFGTSDPDVSPSVTAFTSTREVEYDSGGPVEGDYPRSVAVAYDRPEAMDLAFILHIDDGMAEQDVYYERVAGSGEVWRPTAATRELSAPLYATADVVPRAPLQPDVVGPYPKGRPLGITLGEWWAAAGEGRYTCSDGEGELDLSFENLVPEGVYTLWHDFFVWPPTEPFLGTYDLPFGARDGSDNTFVADANGDARFTKAFKPCLQLSGEQLLSELAIAWHSDGKTHGHEPGEFGTVSHAQLFVVLPKRAGL